MDAERYVTGGGIEVSRVSEELPFADAIEPLVDRLDRHRGVVLASSYEYPGRYTRWDIGFADPPLAITARGRRVAVTALNARGRVMLPWLESAGDGVVMAIEHASLPVAAVQFHPESILTLGRGVGLALVANVVAWARARGRAPGNYSLTTIEIWSYAALTDARLDTPGRRR